MAHLKIPEPVKQIHRKLKEKLISRRNILKSIPLTLAGVFSAKAQAQINPSALPPIIDLALECNDLPLGDYITQLPSDGCQAFSYANAPSTLTQIKRNIFRLSDMDIGYFAGDYVVLGTFRLEEDCETLTLISSEGDAPYGIEWRGTGTYIKNGGINGKGRLYFECYYDATYAGPNFTESVYFDKV